MSWFSWKKQPELFVRKSTIKSTDHALHFVAKHFGLNKGEIEIRTPSHEYYCNGEKITFLEIKTLVEKLSLQLNIQKRIEVQVFSNEKTGYENIICNHHHGPNEVHSLFLPDGIAQYPLQLNASIIQQLCEIHATKIATDKYYIQNIGSTLSFCCGFGIFQILSITTHINSPHLHRSPLSYEAMLYCAAALHDLDFLNIDKYQYYVDGDTWSRLRELVVAIPQMSGRSKYRSEWNRNLEHSADFVVAYGEPLHEEGTLEALERLVARRPDDYNVKHNLAYARMLRGQYELAIKGFDYAISANPFFAYAFNNRGLCNIILGNMNAALEDLKTSARLDSENSFNRRNFGIYWLFRNKPSVALDELLIAQKMDPNTEHIHFWLGKAYFALSNQDEARKQFELSRNIPELPLPEYPM